MTGNRSWGKRYRVGVLLSATGPYSVVSSSMLNGARLGFADFEESGRADFSVDTIIVDPAGEIENYYNAAAALLEGGVRHVIGCYTSSSRKELLPLFERYNALLWYPSHYEGFETSNNVVYTGAVPNQHIMPLVDFLARQTGKRAYCIGSNYIWAWENNRVLREAFSHLRGTVLAEHYLPVGSTDLDHVVCDIIEQKPSFVFNTLIGTSSYTFFRRFREACREAGIDQPLTMPVVSCSLSEPELDAIGPEAQDGHITSSVYFSSIDSAENKRFCAAYESLFPQGPRVCADAESAYLAVRFLLGALGKAGTDDVDAVKRAVAGMSFRAPQGMVSMDPRLLHACLTPRIGRSNRRGAFDLLLEVGLPVEPDPYLISHSPRYAVEDRLPKLRVV